MSQVISFTDFTPPPRYDNVAWASVEVQEAATSGGTYSTIDTLTITPVDADPSLPASRSFTTANASETPALWYQLIFLDGVGNDTLPTLPIQNVPEREPYISVAELAAVLKVNPVTRHHALRRVLNSAADEIDKELGLATPYGSPPALAAEVNLERAVEHWQQAQTPWGIVGLGGGESSAYIARDSWDRHAHKLAPLKVSWGLA